MENTETTSPVKVKIFPALCEQASILANLLELYVHDFSEFVDLKLGADGRFGYEHLPLFWTDVNRYPFLVTVDGNWAGFVFVHKGSHISRDESVWDMEEFFIVRGYRRVGTGTRVAHDVLRRFPGKWEVRVIEQNEHAKEFWASAINEFVGKVVPPTLFEIEGGGWHVFSFESVNPE